jgi:hypothetical protein
MVAGSRRGGGEASMVEVAASGDGEIPWAPVSASV